MNLVSQSYDVQIYSSTTGHDGGNLLASASTVVGGGGAAFYDIPISFTFAAGNFYLLLWRPTDLGFADWLAGSATPGIFTDGVTNGHAGVLRLHCLGAVLPTVRTAPRRRLSAGNKASPRSTH